MYTFKCYFAGFSKFVKSVLFKFLHLSILYMIAKDCTGPQANKVYTMDSEINW